MALVTVTTSATRLDTTATNKGASSIAIYNDGAATVFVGGSDVTTANGLPVPPGSYHSEDLDRGDALYGIVASGTVQVRTRETGLS